MTALIEMSPGTVRMAEELTRARAVEHGAALVVALNGASEYAQLMMQDPSQAAHAKVRARLYETARAAIEDIFAGLDAALAASSVAAHAPAPAEPSLESKLFEIRAQVAATPLFVQPIALCVRYVDDLEEHRLPIEDGRGSFGMTGKLTGDAFLEDATGRRERIGFGAAEEQQRSADVEAGQPFQLDAQTLARVAPSGVVAIQKRDRR